MKQHAATDTLSRGGVRRSLADMGVSLFYVGVALTQIPKETWRSAGQFAGTVYLLRVISSRKLGAVMATDFWRRRCVKPQQPWPYDL